MEHDTKKERENSGQEYSIGKRFRKAAISGLAAAVLAGSVYGCANIQNSTEYISKCIEYITQYGRYANEGEFWPECFNPEYPSRGGGANEGQGAGQSGQEGATGGGGHGGGDGTGAR